MSIKIKYDIFIKISNSKLLLAIIGGEKKSNFKKNIMSIIFSQQILSGKLSLVVIVGTKK